MAANKSAKISSANLHPELILEIFTRLPTKSVCDLRCILDDTYPSFAKYLDTQEFQHKHTFNVLNNPTYQRLFIESSKSGKVILEIDLYQSNLSSPNQIPCIEHKLQGKFSAKKVLRSRIIGASNGLILSYVLFEKANRFQRYSKHLILWNPCTTNYHVLPKSKLLEFGFLDPLAADRTRCGFGYDALNKTYKLVAGMGRNTLLYDLSTNGWKKVETIDVNWFDFQYVKEFNTEKFGVQYGKYLNGALHWIVSPTNIISIDLSTEVMSSLQLPNCHPRSDHQHLGVLNGCLSFSYYGSERKEVSVWVMKEYGKEESWTNISNIMLEIDETPYRIPNYAITKPLLFVPSEDDKEILLFLVEGRLAYAKAQKFTFVEGLKFHYYSFPGVLTVGTLISPTPPKRLSGKASQG